MGTAGRHCANTIEQALFSSGKGFDFHQAMRLIEGTLNDDTQDLFDSALRLRPDHSLGFPSSDIKSCKLDSKKRVEIQLGLMGLYGVDSPLPHYFLDMAAQDNEHAECLRQFLDIFNQRLYSLLYLAWKRCHSFLYLESDQSASSYLNYLKTLSGNTLEDTDGSEFAFAGLFGARTHNATSLENMLSITLNDISVAVRQFVPFWISVDKVSRLGDSEKPIRLGDNALLGESALDLMRKIEIHVGPIAWDQAKPLLPGRSQCNRAVHLISRYLGPTIRFDIILIVFAKEMGALKLGAQERWLGWSTWLGNPYRDIFHLRLATTANSVVSDL